MPGQPTPYELATDPRWYRFVIVVDREGATHPQLSALWRQRIGGLTYRKNLKDVWPESECQEQAVRLPEGGRTRMHLAKPETRLGAGDDRLPVTEVLLLTSRGQQTAVITTARRLGNTIIAGRMFARWCQEHFFASMMEH